MYFQISQMAIKYDSSHSFEIDRLRDAIDFDVNNRKFLRLQNAFDNTFVESEFEISNSGSLPSSGYSSQDKINEESLSQDFQDLEWDIECFDPRKPYCKQL